MQKQVIKYFLIILLVSLPFVFASPYISFVLPTPADGANVTQGTDVEINVSLTESNLGEFIFNWNSANYSFYNEELVFMLNLDNLSALGENDSFVKDLSVYSNNGIVYGATPTANGKYNGAFSFDGSADGIDLGNVDVGNWTDLTVSAWFKTSATTGQMRIMSKDQVGVQGNLILWFTEGDWRFNAYDSVAGDWAVAQYTSTAPNDGEWHHFAGKINQTSNKIALFIDGVLVGSDDFTAATLDDSDSEEFVIGADSDVGSYEQVWDGQIDEFAIWNRSLGLGEIQNLYARGATRLNLSVRSCDDGECSGEDWTDAGDYSPADLSVDNNTYFQYLFDFETDNVSYSPELYNLSLDYGPANSAPSVSIAEPQSTLYLSNESLSLNFIVADDNDAVADLDCWYNADSGANTTIANCQNTTFNISEGSHTLTVFVNDSEGEEGNDSVSFTVDATGVSVSLTEPTGTKTSRTGIPIQYSTIGNNLTCWYNVLTSIGGGVISNTTLANCSSSTFSVSTDDDYAFNLYANNSYGSSSADNSSFTVSTSSSSSSSSSGGSSSSSSSSSSSGAGVASSSTLKSG